MVVRGNTLTVSATGWDTRLRILAGHAVLRALLDLRTLHQGRLRAHEIAQILRIKRPLLDVESQC